MNTIEINPDTWTEISKDSCDVWLKNNFELIKFANDDGIITSSYLTKPLRVISDTPIKAKSNKYTVLLYTTDNTNEEVLEDLNQAINNTLTANTDKDLETKNALEAKDADQDAIIAANKTDADDKIDTTNTRIDETDGIVAQNKIDQAGIDSAQDIIIDSNTQDITNNKTELDAKDALLEQSIADNALADSNLSTTVNDIDTRLTDLELNPVKNINTSLPLSFWVGTQDELDLVVDRDVNTVYIVQE